MGSKFLSSVLFLLSVPAGAASWSAEVGAGAVVAPGYWTALTLTAPGDAGEWTAEVRPEGSGNQDAVTYRHAAGGRFEEPVFLADATRALLVKFSSQGLTRWEVRLPLASRLFPGHLIAVSGLSAVDQAALADVLMPREPVRVFPLPPEQWPRSPLSYGGISVLAVTDPGAVLSPAQRLALRAWIASGGRLLVAGGRDDGLAAQLGAIHGLGAVVEHRGDWKTEAALRPYGDTARLGTRFEPPAEGKSSQGAPDSLPTLLFTAAWGAAGALFLVLRKNRTMGRPVVLALAASLAAAGLLAVAEPWDQGLSTQLRAIELPDLGRYVSYEVRPSAARSGPFEWPEGSPWALAAWKQAHPAAVRLSQDRWAVVTFEPFTPAPETFRYQDSPPRWSERRGTAWVDLEVPPAALSGDAAWVSQVTRGQGTTWELGLDGRVTWLRPREAAP